MIKIRCSSIGYIMTEPKEKSPYDKFTEACEKIGLWKAQHDGMNKSTKTAEKKLAAIQSLNNSLVELEMHKDDAHLSKTCRGHLADIYVRMKYGRQTDISNKYTMKGNMVEEDSLTLYSRHKKTYFKKNAEHFTNDHITGTPDILQGSTVIDIKSSWDIFTFFRNNEADLNLQYYWQLQGYMALTGATEAKLAYCLVNTPELLIMDEKRRLMYKMNVATTEDPDYVEACNELDKLMIYDDIPTNEKVIEIEVQRNDEDIQRIYDRVEECRKYLENKYPSPSTILATHDESVNTTLIEKI